MTMPEGLVKKLTLLGILEEQPPPADSTPVERGSTQYLRMLKELHQISLIYYPGSGSDNNSLEGAFQKSEIVYLDESENNLDKLKPDRKLKPYSPRNLIYGTAEDSPFLDETFDAVFIQDLHPTNEEFVNIMRTLKKGGVLIFSTDDCGDHFGEDVVLNDLIKHPELTQLTLPFRTKFYTSFQKLAPQNLP